MILIHDTREIIISLDSFLMYVHILCAHRTMISFATPSVMLCTYIQSSYGCMSADLKCLNSCLQLVGMASDGPIEFPAHP